jgi:DNA-binding FadR family transcriptional regulator
MEHNEMTPQLGQPLSEQIAAHLRNMIFEQHRFHPGDRMPDERSLAKEIGVSRTSLREAIKILVANGVLVIRRGVGTFVSETPGKQEDPFGFAFEEDKKQLLSDWYQVRLIIESEAMDLVVKNATDEELQRLEDLAQRQSNLIDTLTDDANSFYEFMAADREFHNALASATHSTVMVRILPALFEWIYFGAAVGVYTRLSFQLWKNAKESHKSIVEFLKKRDSKGATLAMRYHLLQGLEDVQK